MQPISPEARRVLFTEPERRAIREQLERMLANPLFSHSKRYPTLLRYIVERTLAGALGDLKERTLGCEVFGREANYDTNADPVVRVTAAEIRKRIAQYYHEPGHEGETRIDLAPGSYVPDFEISPLKSAGPRHAPATLTERVALTPSVALTGTPTAVSSARIRRFGWLGLAAVATAAVVLLVVAWFRPWSPRTALDRFWAPVLDSSGTVLLCVGQREFLGSSPENKDQYGGDLPRPMNWQPGPEPPVTLFRLYYMGSQNVAFPDARALGRLSGLLYAKGRRFRMQGESSTSFAELRDGPVVLVGALNNDWTMRLTGPLRFSFERDNDIFWVLDRRNPARRNRAVNYSMNYLDLTEDYALISRIWDPTTERFVVVAGGLTGYGTMAASEFLTDNSYMNAFASSSPRDWWHRNLQVVIATKVINGNSGPPRVVDRWFW